MKNKYMIVFNEEELGYIAMALQAGQNIFRKAYLAGDITETEYNEAIEKTDNIAQKIADEVGIDLEGGKNE